MSEQITKVCSTCKIEKPLSDYYNNRPSRTGKRSQCKQCEREYERKRYTLAKEQGQKYIKNKQESVRNWNLSVNFGITIEQYDKLLAEQNHCCAICDRHESVFKIRLAVDHCHETGEVRGLLCDKCNRTIVTKYNTVEVLEKAITYLQKSHTNWFVPNKERINE